MSEACPAEPWRDPHFLRVAYWGRGQSQAEIARACALSSRQTVTKWMDKHDIPRRQGKPEKIPDSELLDDVRQTAEQVDRPPSMADHDRHGDHSTHRISVRFGSWTDALLAAGVLDHA